MTGEKHLVITTPSYTFIVLFVFLFVLFSQIIQYLDNILQVKQLSQLSIHQCNNKSNYAITYILGSAFLFVNCITSLFCCLHARLN